MDDDEREQRTRDEEGRPRSFRADLTHLLWGALRGRPRPNARESEASDEPDETHDTTVEPTTIDGTVADGAAPSDDRPTTDPPNPDAMETEQTQQPAALDPEEIADLVEGLLADSQRTESAAVARSQELEHRLAERGLEIVALAEELRRAHHEIKLERRSRERLTERVGLGLAAPLQNLLGLITAAETSEPYATGRPWLRAAVRAAEQLELQLNSWREETSKAHDPPGLVRFKPSEALARAVNGARDLAESRDLVVEAHDRAGPQLELLGDPNLFERILDALIQHGIERTRRGCVALEMWWSALDGDEGVIEVEFEDTAREALRGIHSAEAAELVDTPRAKQLARTAHELTERLGGWLERREHSGRVGWRLTVEFPMPEPRRQAG